MYISAGHYIRFAGSSISSVLKSLSKTPPHSPYHSLGYLSAIMHLQGFPDSSVGKESICNAGDPGSIPGSICWRRDRLPTPVFLGFRVSQLVKNLPALQETWAQSLGWEDPLEKEKATHSNVLAWRIPWTVQSTGSQKVRRD